MRFKKIGENEHGPISAVFNAHGFRLGTVDKWHGLFRSTDWRGEVSMLHVTRKEVAQALQEKFDFELGETL